MKEHKSKYDYLRGKVCPYCQSKIKQNADFTVCPACGTPHHRECWEENNGCTTYGCPENPSARKNISFSGEDIGHLTPEEISESLEQSAEKNYINCPNCKKDVYEKSRYCSHCGFNLKENRFDESKEEFEKEYKKRYRDKAVFYRKRLMLTLISAFILIAAVGYLAYLSYSKLDSYLTSDEYQIKTTIESWRQSWEDKDIEKMKLYMTDDYKYFGKNSKAVNLEDRLKKLESSFKTKDQIKIKFSSLVIISDSTTTDNDLKIKFEQSYESGKIKENGIKTLRMYKGEETGGIWKIYRESFD